MLGASSNCEVVDGVAVEGEKGFGNVGDREPTNKRVQLVQNKLLIDQFLRE